MAYTAKDVEKVLQQRKVAGGQRKTFEPEELTRKAGKPADRKQEGMTAEDVEKVLQRRKETGEKSKTFDAGELTMRTGSPKPGTKGKIGERGLGPALDTLRQGDVFGAVDEVGKAIDRAKEEDLRIGTAEQQREKRKKAEDVFARVNAWRDASPRNRELEAALRHGTLGNREQPEYTSYAERGTSVGASAGMSGSYGQTGKSLEQRPYTEKELEQLGYSRKEIAAARRMIQDYDELHLGQKTGRRVLHSVAGVADQLAGGVAMTVGALGSQAAKIAGVETKGQTRVEKLKAAIQRVDGTNGAYTDTDLMESGGWSEEEIAAARAEMEAETKRPDNMVYNWGKAQHERGEKFAADAMSGESDVGRFWHGAATSAAENLALAAANPAAVLPVLTAQTVGDSLAESDKQGEDAGKALMRAAAKGAVGYGIEQLGVEQMLAGMGKSGAGGWAAALVERLSRNPVTRKAPGVWNILAGSAEEAGEEFVETYADAVVDAALDGGWKGLASPKLMAEALGAAAGGAAGGALIGAGAGGYGQLRQKRAEAKMQRIEQAQEARKALEAAADTEEKNSEEMAVQRDLPLRLEAPQEKAEEVLPEAALEEAKPGEGGAARTEAGREENPEPEAMLQEMGDILEPTHESRTVEGIQNGQAQAAQEVQAVQEVQAEERNIQTLQGREEKKAELSRRKMEQRKMSPAAAKIIGSQAPAGVSAESWANAATTLYRLGKTGETESFERAVEVAEGGRGLGVDTASVMAQGQRGADALRLAWMQGRGEYEAGAAEPSAEGLGGRLTEKSLKAKGKIRYEGSLRMDSEEATKLIALNAAATGTDAVLVNAMMTPTGTRSARANAAIDTETGKIFFGDEAEDVLGSVLHEDLHWYNSFDKEGGMAFQRSMLGALAAEYGQEDVESLRAEYRRRYFNLSESQVDEEMVADAVRGLFTEPEHLRRWTEVQRKEAERNGDKRGIIRKVMDSVRGMLDEILKKAKELLRIDPENRAALRAKGMAEERKEILREEYYQHMEKAGEKRRQIPIAGEVEAPAQQTDLHKSAAEKAEEDRREEKKRFEMAEKAAERAADNVQREASRAIMEEEGSSLDILASALGLTRGVQVLDSTLSRIAAKHLHAAGSKADRKSIEAQLRAAVEYLRAEGADMAKGQAVVEQIAENILQGAVEKDQSLWEQHPEYHTLEYTVSKDGPAKAEIVRRWGSWGEAVAEAKRHGVKLRQEAGYRDRNPIDQLESVLRDDKDQSGAELFREAAERVGVAGAESLEASEWLEVLMNVRDSIKPVERSRYQDEAEFEDAVMEETVSILQDILEMPEVSKVEMLVEANQQAIRDAAEEGARKAGADERTAQRIGKEASAAARGSADEVKRMRHILAAQERRRSSQQSEMEQWMQSTREVLELHGVEPKKTAAGMQRQVLELYERQAKKQVQALEKARREMLDEVELAYRRRERELERKLKRETHRANFAEYQLIVQEREILEWEEENQRKQEEWERKQAEKNAKALNRVQEYMEEEVNREKAIAEKRVQKARDGRRREQLRRSIRKGAAQLNQMILRPNTKGYVQEHLLPMAAQVAVLSDEATSNQKAVERLARLRGELAEAAKRGEIDTGTDGRNDLEDLVNQLIRSLEGSRSRQLEQQQKRLAEAQELESSPEGADLVMRIKAKIRQLENETMPLYISTEELAMLNDAVKGAVHIVRTANRTLSQEKSQEIGEFAAQAAEEVRNSEGNGLYGATLKQLDGLQMKAKQIWLSNVLQTLSPGRLFSMVGGYRQGGQMDQLGKMLQEGQDRQHEIAVGGERMFAPLTQDEKGVKGFAGRGAELVDIGLKDRKGNPVLLNHAQLCSLKMHMMNADSLRHLETGGFVVPEPKLYQAGKVQAAYQNGVTVNLMDLGKEGLLGSVDAALTEYDKEWIKTMREFFDHYTADIINATSLKLVGFKRAMEENYFPISVDGGTLAREIDGLKHDGTIAGRGFLKERQKSSKPILLEECQTVVMRSLRDTADYGGLALPIRDVQRVLNAPVETEDGPVILKSKIIQEKWGRQTVEAIDKVLTDLQARPRPEDDPLLKGMEWLRGNYAQAVLGMNTGVVLSQISGAAANGAVLDGAATMKTLVQAVRNLRPSQQAALRERMRLHGGTEMEWRMLGQDGQTLADVAGKKMRVRDLYPTAIEILHLPEGMSIMDEATVSAAWAGAESYVAKHPAEFELEAEDVRDQSEDYWDAVRGLFNLALHTTQPGAGVMQQAARQRSKDGLMASLNMFKGQGFQNKGLLLDAYGEWRAARKRWGAKTAKPAMEQMQRANRKFARALVSQAVSALLFAASRMLRDLLLRREKMWQDENGDVSAAKIVATYGAEFVGSFAAGFMGMEGLFAVAEHIISGARYNLVELTGLDGVENSVAAMEELWGYLGKLVKRETEGYSENEREKYNRALLNTAMDLATAACTVAGIPLTNLVNIGRAIGKWIGREDFSDLPKSPVGQYDRLYAAFEEEDAEQAAGALEKLKAMGKDEKEIYSQLGRRLKEENESLQQAARDRAAGREEPYLKAKKTVIERLYKTLQIQPSGKRDAEKRNAVTEMVERTMDVLLNQELAAEDEGGVYGGLLKAAKETSGAELQKEVRRLLTAGKEKTTVKSRITAAVKGEYRRTDETKRKKMNQMLLDLRDEEGKPFYTAKEILRWMKEREE